MRTVLNALLLLLLAAPLAIAQDTPIAFDTEGEVLTLSRQQRSELGLFPNVDGFREARLYRTPTGEVYAEITVSREGEFLRERQMISEAHLEAIRTAFARQSAPPEVPDTPRRRAPQREENARGELMRGSLMLSLGYYGWAVPASIGLEGGSYTAAYLLAAPTFFFTPYFLTYGDHVPTGAARMALYGASRGIIDGIALTHLVSDGSAEGDVALGMGAAMGLAEGLAGYAWASATDMTAGTQATLAIGGDFGYGWGLGAVYLAGLSGEDQPSATAGVVLGGHALGLAVGGWLAADQPYTPGNADVLESAGLLGAYLPIAALSVAGVEEEKAYASALLAGSFGGLLLGDMLTQGVQFDEGQGRLVSLGTLAGGLFGGGIAYLVVEESGNNPEATILGYSALGALAGFSMTYALASAEDAAGNDTALELRFRPENYLLGRAMDRGDFAGRDPFVQPPPFAELSWRF